MRQELAEYKKMEENQNGFRYSKLQLYESLQAKLKRLNLVHPGVQPLLDSLNRMNQRDEKDLNTGCFSKEEIDLKLKLAVNSGDEYISSEARKVIEVLEIVELDWNAFFDLFSKSAITL